MKLYQTWTPAIAALILCFSQSPASALDWVQVSTSLEGSMYYVDANSIKRDGRITWYWTYLVNHEPDENGAVYSIAHYSADCSNGFTRQRELILSNEYNEVIFSHKKGNKGLVDNVIPGSIGYAAFKYACSR